MSSDCALTALRSGGCAPIIAVLAGTTQAMTESIRAEGASNDATAGQSRDSRKTTYELNKLRKRLRRQVGSAIADYNMVE